MDKRSPAARKSIESQAGAAASPPLQPAPTDERPAEKDPLDTGVAEQVSLEPDASADVAASNSSDAGVFRSVEAAGRVFERSPCFSWLLIKAVEAERSSSSDYDSCPRAAAAGELLLGGRRWRGFLRTGQTRCQETYRRKGCSQNLERRVRRATGFPPGGVDLLLAGSS